MSSSDPAATATGEGFTPATARKDTNYHLASGGYSASIRLNLQHYLITQQLGGHLLHPDIKFPADADPGKEEEEGLCVADVGAGTGIWLLDLLKQHQLNGRGEITYDAFDITRDFFPYPSYLPSNLSFHYLDILKPIPEEFQNRYDVVNVRFLGPVFHLPGDSEGAVERLSQMLKPGGWLQWAERDMVNAEIVMPPFRSSPLSSPPPPAPSSVSAPPSASSVNPAAPPKTSAVQRFKDVLSSGWKKAGDSYDWYNHLTPTLINNGGLQEVKHERYETPRELVGFNMEIICLTFEEAAATAVRLAAASAEKSGGDKVEEREKDSKETKERNVGADFSQVLPVIRDAYREYREEGTAMASWVNLYIGRKPF